MDEVKELIKKAEGLLEKEQFNEIITFLSDALLDKNSNADLYAWRSRAHNRLNEIEKAIEYATKAISSDFHNPCGYRQRGYALDNKKEYDNAIADFTKAIDLKNDDAITYNNRGWVWYEKEEYDKAIGDFDKAIELKKDIAMAYLNRGNAWISKGENDKAIDDYDKAINLKNGYADAYNNRGAAWSNKEEHDKAISDYCKAIEFKKDYPLVYVNRGQSKEKLNKDKEALRDYDMALEFDSMFPKAILFRDQLSAKLGIPLKFDTAKADGTLYQIILAVDQIKEEKDKLDLIKYYKLEIEPVINGIRKHASKIDDIFWTDGTGKLQPKLLAHYSNLKIADLLIAKEKTRLRYSNAVFMNDPEEGKTLIDYLDFLEEQKKEKQGIKEAFYRIQKEERTNFYLGSFLPVKDFHEDELLMWRTYGKDENKNEAAGCCLVVDVGFFDNADGKLIAIGTDDQKKPVEIAHPIYKVIYCNKRKGKIEGDINDMVSTELEKLKNVMKELLGKRTKKESKKNKAIDRILYHSLSELRYFFKSADYFFENELRVIQFATHSDIVKIDNENSFLPRKMYIESSKEIKPYLKKLTLGPKVQHPERWMYLEEQMKREGYKMEMAYSNCQFQ